MAKLTTASLKDLSRVELMEKAKDMGLKGFQKLRKDDMIALIMEHVDEADEPEVAEKPAAKSSAAKASAVKEEAAAEPRSRSQRRSRRENDDSAVAVVEAPEEDAAVGESESSEGESESEGEREGGRRRRRRRERDRDRDRERPRQEADEEEDSEGESAEEPESDNEDEGENESDGEREGGRRRRRRRGRDRDRGERPERVERPARGEDDEESDEESDDEDDEDGYSERERDRGGNNRRPAVPRGLLYASGILELLPEGYGFLRGRTYLPSHSDIYVSVSQVRRFGLRMGDMVLGEVRSPKPGEKYFGLLKVATVNGTDPEIARRRPNFDQLTPIFPEERYTLESEKTNDYSRRIIDLF